VCSNTLNSDKKFSDKKSKAVIFTQEKLHTPSSDELQVIGPVRKNLPNESTVSVDRPSAATVFTTVSSPACAQSIAGGSRSARPLITGEIDQNRLVSLPGHVLKSLTPERDLGAVEDGTPIPLFLVLKRSVEQQADPVALVAAQQQPGSP
jgi:hypothetical protein